MKQSRGDAKWYAWQLASFAWWLTGDFSRHLYDMAMLSCYINGGRRILEVPSLSATCAAGDEIARRPSCRENKLKSVDYRRYIIMSRCDGESSSAGSCSARTTRHATPLPRRKRDFGARSRMARIIKPPRMRLEASSFPRRPRRCGREISLLARAGHLLL